MRQALEMALEALEQIDRAFMFTDGMKAITAIKEALAQPEQEPVALPCCGYTDASAIKWNPYNQVVQCHNCGQIYTTPPQPEQEPDEVDIRSRLYQRIYELEFARAIEAAHGIK